MVGMKFRSERFRFAVEFSHGVALVRLGETEERWPIDAHSGFGDPQIISETEFEALVFGTRAVLATKEASWVIRCDYPIWDITNANGSILVVEELGFRTFSSAGAMLASAMPMDIPYAWSVTPEGLRYEDFDRNRSLWSLPGLELLEG